jgi:hypothetical protein
MWVAEALRQRSNMADEGYFIDWNGNARRTDDPGNGYHCEVDRGARYVAVMSKSGAMMHEATLYLTLEAIAKAGLKAEFLPGSQPWGERDSES